MRLDDIPVVEAGGIPCLVQGLARGTSHKKNGGEGEGYPSGPERGDYPPPFL